MNIIRTKTPWHWANFLAATSSFTLNTINFHFVGKYDIVRIYDTPSIKKCCLIIIGSRH